MKEALHWSELLGTFCCCSGTWPAAEAQAKLPPPGRAVAVRRPHLSWGRAESFTKGLLKAAAMLSPALCPTSKLLYRE